MNLQKTPGNHPVNISTQLEELTDCIEKLNNQYKSKKEISEEIRNTLKKLLSCNETLQDKKFTPDQKISKNMQSLLAALTHLQFINNDKSLQEKVNALQTGLFAAYMKALEKLEENLKNKRRWRIGENVEKSNKSKTT